MKKLIIALLLAPSYLVAMRSGIENSKNIEVLRQEFNRLQQEAAQAEADAVNFPNRAQAQLQSVSRRLVKFTNNDLAQAKSAAVQSGIRAQVKNRRQGQGAAPYSQDTTMQEYQALEQQLNQFTRRLSSLQQAAAKKISRSYARRQPSTSANRANKLTHAPANRTQARATSSPSKKIQESAAEQVYTIDYTQD